MQSSKFTLFAIAVTITIATIITYTSFDHKPQCNDKSNPIEETFTNDKSAIINESQQQPMKTKPLSKAYQSKNYCVDAMSYITYQSNYCASLLHSQSYIQSESYSVLTEPPNEFYNEAETVKKFHRYQSDYPPKAINISWVFRHIFDGMYSPTATPEQTRQVNKNNNVNNKSIATLSGTDGIGIGGGVGVAATDATLSSATRTHTSPGLFAVTLFVLIHYLVYLQQLLLIHHLVMEEVVMELMELVMEEVVMEEVVMEEVTMEDEDNNIKRYKERYGASTDSIETDGIGAYVGEGREGYDGTGTDGMIYVGKGSGGYDISYVYDDGMHCIGGDGSYGSTTGDMIENDTVKDVAMKVHEVVIVN